MTSEERAEKIHEIYLATARKVGWPIRPENDRPYAEIPEASKALDIALAEYIAAEIREASEKAFDEGLENRKDVEAEKVAIAEWTEVYRQEAKAEAYEDAAKIAENSFLDWELFLVNHAGDANLIAERAFITDRIRARAAEVGK